ncbi:MULTISPECIES: hypothetical protein [Clostridia]|uniref:Flagellin N-terminal-like domain-containing protein n=2 Tax=Clostridia TaxID=186801 RepID=A0A1G6A0Q9_EUBOX|nr:MULTISPECIES: hypothetical protein [Clostridia]SDB02058.1 hypothetical protein SAMN02910417_00122 [Eubacterium oxidoreducens]SDY44962.1 hypothetical protein SAMN02910414_01582 [Lachnobacterium bovis DSM 14045]SEI82573.1 hypothetical protein SAMN02910453_1420 [Lachnospiraceae bacterium A10]
MNKLVRKMDGAIIRAKNFMAQKVEGSDQIIIMFIIIAVAAGIAGLLYIFGTKTLLPNFQNKITTLINGWFDHN